VTPNDRILLAILAFSTLIMAVSQVVILIGGVVLARRINAAIARIEDATMPVLAHLDSMAAEGLTALATLRDQLGRVEQATTEIVSRVDHTMQRLQAYVLTPARQGVALLAGARAVMEVFRRATFSR
jgi:hypothetical protein